MAWRGSSRFRTAFWLALVLGALLAHARAGAQQSADRRDHSSLTVQANVKTIQPGVPFTVALRVTLDPGWHTYWINPGDSGLPFEITWELPAGFTVGPLRWPPPQLLPYPPLMSYGFENELVLVADMTPPSSTPTDRAVQLRGSAEWLVCADVCLPAAGKVDVSLPVRTTPTITDDVGAARIVAARARVPQGSNDWRLGAWATDSGYVLEATPPRGLALPAPYFFVDTIAVVDHARAQRVMRAGAAYRIVIARSPFAEGRAARLRGVLAADVGHQASPSYVVDVAITPPPPRVAANPGAIIGPVQETGGVRRAARADTAASRLATTPATLAPVSLAVLFAFLGGLLLNLMPCVFPVLSVKVLSFVEQSGGSARVARQHAFAFGTGVLVSFWALAGTLIALRAAGQELGWGFQLQSPAVVGVLALVLFALALSMSGVFEAGSSLTRLGGIGRGRGYSDSFLTGLLAVVVATPCTAPFMGSALGYALVQAPLVAFTVFSALGAGLAAPYVIVSSAPALLRRLPRPGPWMETFKQFLAFPLYATVAWLVWVFARQVGVDGSALLLFALIALALAAWIWGRTGIDRRPVMRAVALLVAILGVITVLRASNAAPHVGPATVSDDWEPFSDQRVAELRASNRPIFIDFTAAWCLSCQVNERVALANTSTRRAFAEAHVARLRADWTSRDSSITRALQTFGRSGVPLYVLYPADGAAAPVILPALLTPSIVVRAIEAASRPAIR